MKLFVLCPNYGGELVPSVGPKPQLLARDLIEGSPQKIYLMYMGRVHTIRFIIFALKVTSTLNSLI